MRMKITTLCLMISIVFSFAPAFANAADFNPNYIVSDDEMTDMTAMSQDDLSLFLLQRGFLGSYATKDVAGVKRAASDIIWNAAVEFELNPQFLLVLLQREQSLVEDPNPTQDQLDWAMGYAVCDDCAKDDPQIQKYKGFGNQVYYAAKRIRESYLTDIAATGMTVSGVGPGIVTLIDDMDVTPFNAATAVLYTYTPHLHGNENFAHIWARWFTRDYPSGTLLQNTEDGGVWLIQYGMRRPITSRTAFLSRFNEANLIPVKPTTLQAYPMGAPISFANYSLLRSPHGTVYLVVDDTIRGFASQEAFRALGFNPEEITDVTFEDLAAYTEGEPITVDSSYPQGTLLQDNTTGGVFYVEGNVKHPLLSREILMNRFPNWPITPVAPDALAALETGDAVGFADGTLVGVAGTPAVYVISDGLRRPILDGDTFEAFGWKWENVVWTNERSVSLHPIGELVVKERADDTEETAVTEALTP